MSIDQFLKNATKRSSKEKQIAEIDIEKPFCRYAITKNCKALKLVLLRLRSFPDRTVLCPGGKIFFVEFKRKGKSLTEGQEKWKRILVSFGFEYYVCDQKGQAESILDEFLAFNT